MKIEKGIEINVPAELAEQFPYRTDWRHLTPTELTGAERLLAHLEHVQGVVLDEEASRAVQLSYDVLHKPMEA